MIDLIFTCGDINGIGPEIIIKTINGISSIKGKRIFILCPLNAFEKAAAVTPPEFNYLVIKANRSLPCDHEGVILIDTGRTALCPGIPTAKSGLAAYKALIAGIKIAKESPSAAIITAPLSKHAFELAGINYSGHTEILGESCGSSDFLMTFLSRQMNVALLTIHIPISQIPDMITEKRIISAVRILKNTWERDFGIKTPSVAVLALNPHAGEMGRIGYEEEKIIKPAIAKIVDLTKFRAEGPFVPDAFFANRLYKNYDVVLAMYHDQALIPFKLLNFSNGVNYTAGLPLVRISPDHGTAFDIAYKGVASCSSMLQACKHAEKILKNRLKYAER